MNIQLICVGKPLSGAYKELYDQYTQRIGKWVVIEETIISPARLSTVNLVRQDESKKIIAHLQPSTFVVALDERGRQFDSVMLSAQFNQWRSQQKKLVFVIGGSYGFDSTVMDRADVTWSLSEAVYPHELVRVMFAEQLYRSLSIEYGLPYHHS